MENKMKITKRQLRRIIREEYSRMKRQKLIREASYDDHQGNGAPGDGRSNATELLDLIDVFEDDGLEDDEIVEGLSDEGFDARDAAAALRLVSDYGPKYGPVRILNMFLQTYR